MNGAGFLNIHSTDTKNSILSSIDERTENCSKKKGSRKLKLAEWKSFVTR